MTKQTLEAYQVVVYLAAILIGLSIGSANPGLEQLFEGLLWPVLGVLLYVTFTQISLDKLPNAFRDTRFLTTALAGNFILVPLLVWGLVTLLPADPAIRLGVAMVLLVPCTDWFITFTQMGGGDTERAIAFTPVSLLLQMVLLPFYLFLMFGQEFTVDLATKEMLLVFTGIILLPMTLAYMTGKWASPSSSGSSLIAILGWLPVPLLAVVIFMIAASQVQLLDEASSILWQPVIIYAGYLCLAILMARVLSNLMNLPAPQGRVLAFSLGSRNSFVVLPIALALPASYEMAVIVIVLQSLIELVGMAIFVWLVPRMFKH